MITETIRNSKKAVIPYITAGLPSFEDTGALIRALADAGAPAIEIGIPFSDPMADGPVIQKASKMSLDAGFSLDELFLHLREWCGSVSIPLIVMTYINPLVRRGIEETLIRIKESGVSGVIIPDLPSDPADIFEMSKSIGIDLIRLVAPTTKPERIKDIVEKCTGFVYSVSIKGVTGSREIVPQGLKKQVQLIKSMTDLPVCVGFGVSKKEHIEEILKFADGVIVGSYLVEKLMDTANPVKETNEAFLRLIK
jgi:tryptophan synthase alpha chain